MTIKLKPGSNKYFDSWLFVFRKRKIFIYKLLSKLSTKLFGKIFLAKIYNKDLNK